MAWRDPWETVDRANALRAQTDAQGVNMLTALQGMQTNALQQQQLRQGMADEQAVRKAYSQAGGDLGKLRELLTSGGQYKQLQALEKADLDRRKTLADIGKDEADAGLKKATMFRDTVAGINDQAGWDALRASPELKGRNLPEVFSPEIKQSLVMRADDYLKRATPEYKQIDIGGKIMNVDVNPFTNPAIKGTQFDKTNTPDALLSAETQRRGQNMTDARSREANAISKEAQQTQLVNDPNQGLLLVNKGTKVATPAVFGNGQPVPSEAQVGANKLNRQLSEAITLARGLIPKATASGAGALVDQGAAFFGKSTPGGDAASQLDTLAGWMVSNVPRMQGPQSDKDVLLYRQMAAQVGDKTQPVSRRMAALDTLETLQKKYADISATPYEKPGGATGGVIDFNSLPKGK